MLGTYWYCCLLSVVKFKLVSQFLKILQNPNSNSSYIIIIIEVIKRVRCEIIKYEVVQLVARGDLQDPSAYANGKRPGSRKVGATIVSPFLDERV